MRTRLNRIALFVGWTVVSLLAVAGFAAFSAPDEPEAAPAVEVGTVGRNAGSVSALIFTYQAPPSTRPAPRTSTTVNLDAAVQEEISRRLTEAPATTQIAEDEEVLRHGTFVRSGVMTEAEVRALVSQYFRPEDVNKAIRIAWCESSFNPNSVNPTSGASGLFQHLPQYWEERSRAAGWAGADVFDPEANVAVAAWLLYEQPGGWSHWECNA